ncbi:hypothetical protein Bbelb_192250 [Branchiostoma belcheri]|nr:hypothetical protein Bbelb_192250 [Branchiostoma belcheri]
MAAVRYPSQFMRRKKSAHRIIQCLYPGSLPCTNGRGCIQEAERCDGIVQCSDGSDEDNCLARVVIPAVQIQIQMCRPGQRSYSTRFQIVPYLSSCEQRPLEVAVSCDVLSNYAKHGLGLAQPVVKPQAVVTTVQKHHPAPVVMKSHPAPAPVKGQPVMVQPVKGQPVMVQPVKGQPVVVQAPKQVVMLQQVVNLACQTGYIMGEDHLCYRFSTDVVKYADAERACAQDGAGLAVLKDEVSHGFVYGFLQAYNPHNPHWIGLDDRMIEGQYVYADGAALGKFNHWDTAQPDDADRDQDCVQMQGYYWDDRACCEEKHYICQAPPAQQITCFCHNHSNQCTMDGGCADCQHNTMGAHCEMCQPGFAGAATQGTPNDCLPIQAYRVMHVKQPLLVMQPKGKDYLTIYTSGWGINPLLLNFPTDTKARQKATEVCPGQISLMYEVNDEPADLVYNLSCPEKADDCPPPDTVQFLTKVCLCCAEHKILNDCIFCTAFP